MSEVWEANGTIDKNNSELHDMGEANQNLTAEDIEAMKESGIDGKAIIAAVIANSETFETKTQFAQVDKLIPFALPFFMSTMLVPRNPTCSSVLIIKMLLNEMQSHLDSAATGKISEAEKAEVLGTRDPDQAHSQGVSGGLLLALSTEDPGASRRHAGHAALVGQRGCAQQGAGGGQLRRPPDRRGG
jgi:hypothetical protein